MHIYETIEFEEEKSFFRIRINRTQDNNSINQLLVKEINKALDYIEQKTAPNVILFEGKEGLFCTGMDFKEFVLKSEHESDKNYTENPSDYINTLRRFSLIDRIIVSCVNGKVLAGGIGFVAASDIVLASSTSTFGLSEAIWGLLPACVTPYLIRRVGFQKAYAMTLTTMPINAEEAYRIHLVDEVGDIYGLFNKYLVKIRRIDRKTIAHAKEYFRKMWMISSEIEKIAVEKLKELQSSQYVQKNISRFLTTGKFPWNEHD